LTTQIFSPTPNQTEQYIILIVEDEINSRETLSKLLKREGYLVLEAGSGEEALEKYKYSDAMIVDGKLPGIDGIETVKRIQQNQPNKKVVISTAYPSLKVKAQQSGIKVQDFFDKPFYADQVWDKFIGVLAGLRDERDVLLNLITEVELNLLVANDTNYAEDVRHESFISAKNIIVKQFWSIFKESEYSKQQLVIMLDVVTRGLSFVESPKLKISRPNNRQIATLLIIIKKLKQTYVTEKEELECERLLTQVGLNIEPELFSSEIDNYSIFQ
jgi:two-component system, response regulator, stage 0 sporulation protein F